MGWQQKAAVAAAFGQVVGSIVGGATGSPPDQVSQLADYQQLQNERRAEQFGDSTSMKSSESSRSAEIRKK